MTRTTRLVTWLLSTITIVVLLFGYQTSTAGALQTGSAVLGSATPGASGLTGSGSSSTGSSSTGSGSTGSGSAGSGSAGTQTVTGPTVQTQWGPVQVEITVQNGAITDVAVPAYPDSNGRDVEINNYALPILMQETLDQQSADIDMVSGATVTSVGYLTSLQAALDEAGL